MNDLITTEGNSDRPTVMGRRLHEELEVATQYTMWFDRMCEYGFTEGIDYVVCLPNLVSETRGGQNKQDHQMTMDMAKEIAMLQRTEKGKEVRQYFITVEKAWNDPMATLARSLQFSQKLLDSFKSENAHLQSTLQIQAPKVLFADAVAGSHDSINVGTMAKLLKKNGYEIGEQRFYEWLRTNGYCIREKGRSYNRPTQRSMELKIMEIKESTRISASGTSHLDQVTLVTGKGQIYFLNKLIPRMELAGVQA